MKTYNHLLSETYKKIKEKNYRYSMHAFSRDIGIGPTSLSRIMSGKRKLTAVQAYKIGLYLNLSRDELLDFIISTLTKRP